MQGGLPHQVHRKDPSVSACCEPIADTWTTIPARAIKRSCHQPGAQPLRKTVDPPPRMRHADERAWHPEPDQVRTSADDGFQLLGFRPVAPKVPFWGRCSVSDAGRGHCKVSRLAVIRCDCLGVKKKTACCVDCRIVLWLHKTLPPRCSWRVPVSHARLLCCSVAVQQRHSRGIRDAVMRVLAIQYEIHQVK